MPLVLDSTLLQQKRSSEALPHGWGSLTPESVLGPDSVLEKLQTVALTAAEVSPMLAEQASQH